MELSQRKLNLNARHYRTIPIDQPGYEDEEVILDADKTTFLAMHCWNIGCPGGPALDRNYFDGLCFPHNFKEGYRICTEVIQSAMEASRKAGILVSHAEDTSIVKRYPAGVVEADVNAPPNSPPPACPGAVPGHRKSMLERAYGADWETRSPWSRMDRIDFLMPQGDEPFIYQSGQLDRLLRKKGIENIIYTGFCANLCIIDAGGGALPMADLGYRVFLIREGTLGLEYPDSFDEKVITRYAIRHFETWYGHSISFDNYMQNCALLGEGR